MSMINKETIDMNGIKNRLSKKLEITSFILSGIIGMSLLLSATSHIQAANANANSDEDEGPAFQTGDQVEVMRGDFIISRDQSPYLYLPKQESLHFEHANAILASVEVRRGDMVEAGDILMTFEREEDLAASEARRIELERLRSQIEQEETQIQNQLKDLRAAVAAEPDTHQKAILRIDIQIAEEQLQWQQSSNERRLEALEEADREATADLEVTELLAPFAGEIVDITSRKIGDRLDPWEYMGRIIGQEPFLLQVDNSYNEFRLGEQVSIMHGPARERESMQALVVADQSLLDPELVNPTAWLAIEAVDAREAIQAINPKVQANQEAVKDVLLLPRRAVMRQNQDFFVNLSTDSGIVRRYVQVGNWNPDVYWIIDGLEEGDSVVIE